MNTAAQPLDHRAFLQQFILALASRGVQGLPFDGIPSKVTAYAQDVWEGIEAAVDERHMRFRHPDARG